MKRPRTSRTAGALAGALAVSLAAAVLVAIAPASTAARLGPLPVVLMHGWSATGAGWGTAVTKLTQRGLTVLDFDADRPGIQALTFGPDDPTQHVSYLAGKIVQPRIDAALARAGYPPGQPIDVVAHSMGGLVARFLIEQPGADVDNWSSKTGWYGDGIPDVASDWAARIDDLVMMGTPNHGTWAGWVPSTVGAFGVWNAAGADLRPSSTFLKRMGYREPAGEYYVSIGGAPKFGQGVRRDYDGDGVAHGFDMVVPAESTYVVGSDLSIVAVDHGDMRRAPASLDLAAKALGMPATPIASDTPPLHGNVSVRLEYARIVGDHDFLGTDENRFEVWVDPDGDADSFRKVKTFAYNKDAPFTKQWGNAGPTSRAIPLPGTGVTVDVKVVAYESDSFGSRDPVATFTLTNLRLSEDGDGQDYYEATAYDSRSGVDRIRISLLGFTAS